MQVYSITLNDLSESNRKQLLDAGYLENATITIILDDPPRLFARQVRPKSNTEARVKARRSGAKSGMDHLTYEDKLRKMVRETFTADMTINPTWNPVVVDEFNKMFSKPEVSDNCTPIKPKQSMFSIPTKSNETDT